MNRNRFVTIGERLRSRGLKYERLERLDVFTDPFLVSVVADEQTSNFIVKPHMFVQVKGLSQLSRLVDLLDIAYRKGQEDGRDI